VLAEKNNAIFWQPVSFELKLFDYLHLFRFRVFVWPLLIIIGMCWVAIMMYFYLVHLSALESQTAFLWVLCNCSVTVCCGYFMELRLISHIKCLWVHWVAYQIQSIWKLWHGARHLYFHDLYFIGSNTDRYFYLTFWFSIGGNIIEDKPFFKFICHKFWDWFYSNIIFLPLHTHLGNLKLTVIGLFQLVWHFVSYLTLYVKFWCAI